MVDKIRISDSNDGKLQIKWHGYEDTINKKLDYAQKFVDSEVIRLCDPYTPEDSSDLIKSVTINTKIGSGKVIWRTPYARRMYYGNYAYRGAPIKGSHWGARAMNAGGYAKIKKGVAEVLKK